MGSETAIIGSFNDFEDAQSAFADLRGKDFGESVCCFANELAPRVPRPTDAGEDRRLARLFHYLNQAASRTQADQDQNAAERVEVRLADDSEVFSDPFILGPHLVITWPGERHKEAEKTLASWHAKIEIVTVETTVESPARTPSPSAAGSAPQQTA